MKTLGRPPAWEILRVLATIRQSGEQVERSCHKYRTIPTGEGTCAPERGRSIAPRLDMREVRPREARELFGWHRAMASRGGRDHGVAQGCQRPEHLLGPLVVEDRDHDRVTARREPRQQVADAGQVVRSVPDLQ